MTREKLLNQIAAYIPYNEQEATDRELILHWIQDHDDAFTRQNKVAHITASAWVVNRDRRKVLLVYHNIYNSWSWLGGHADGETDLLAVALREVKEEAGIVYVVVLPMCVLYHRTSIRWNPSLWTGMSKRGSMYPATCI